MKESDNLQGKNKTMDKLFSIFKTPDLRRKILIIAGLLLLAVYKKEWIVAATVNGSPVSNIDLQTRLNQQFRQNTLNQMINEKIILDEAAKNNVAVSEEDVNQKIKQVEDSLGAAKTSDCHRKTLFKRGHNIC